jgi:flavin-dependent dehydrogenase
MSSPRSLFRTVVNKNAPHETRKAAIGELAEIDATTQLRVIVVADGLNGSFRRQALNALGRCRATTELRTLVDDTSLPTALRERADQLR